MISHSWAAVGYSSYIIMAIMSNIIIILNLKIVSNMIIVQPIIIAVSAASANNYL